MGHPSMTCPTIKVDDGNGGYYEINESDFDDKTMTKYGEKKTRKPRAKASAK
jgi:hypothetical protein